MSQKSAPDSYGQLLGQKLRGTMHIVTIAIAGAFMTYVASDFSSSAEAHANPDCAETATMPWENVAASCEGTGIVLLYSLE